MKISTPFSVQIHSRFLRPTARKRVKVDGLMTGSTYLFPNHTIFSWFPGRICPGSSKIWVQIQSRTPLPNRWFQSTVCHVLTRNATTCDRSTSSNIISAPCPHTTSHKQAERDFVFHYSKREISFFITINSKWQATRAVFRAPSMTWWCSERRASPGSSWLRR